MFHDAPNVNYLFAELLVEELLRHGVEWFVISPGSRSAPLARSAAAHPRTKHVVHFDERGAAYHALGIAKASLKPAAFICTSGTATANALPAAIEASYSGIPLVLITADRPERLHGSGANQTIDQRGLYRKFVRHESNFAVEEIGFDASAVLTEIDRAIQSNLSAWPGPVHLNCQLDEPLVPEPCRGGMSDWDHTLAPLAEWISGDEPFTPPPKKTKEVAPESLDALEEIMARPAPGIIVVGQLSGSKERDEVHAILKRLQWPFIPDVTSGLRLGPPLPWSLWSANHHAGEIFEHARTVIHIGGPVTSRRLLDPMARFRTDDHSDREFVRLSAAPGDLDPYGNVSLRVNAPPTVLNRLAEPLAGAKVLAQWPQLFFERNRRVYNALSNAFPPSSTVTELSVAYFTSMFPPVGGVLFAGNSLPIRELDVYGTMNLQQQTWVAANRGASGIDGNVATAAGIARATRAPVVALLGDLAVLHDLNSLALLCDLPAPVVLVAINNDGGGIFHFLPIAAHADHFEELFGTPHGCGFADAAALFRLPYALPETNAELIDAQQDALDQNQSRIIEVRSDRNANREQHRDVDAIIHAALDNPPE
jgi:2-succinyl-5-enolpyruvyl-6-hydroxy-3-cyclohexene-1-carboxylate synthase